MSESISLFQRHAQVTVAKMRRPLSVAGRNLLAKATAMVACEEAADVDDALDTLRLAQDPDYRTVAAEKEASMPIAKSTTPIAKSTTDVAWAAVSALGWDLVQRKKAATFEDAVAQLKQQSHPSYLTYLASLGSGSAPEGVATTEGVVKRAQVIQEVQKRVDRLVRSGQAQTDAEAMAAVFKADRDLYNRHRAASYAKGPLPPVEADVRVVPTGPVYAQIRKMALELRSNDPWGQYAGKSAVELEEEVLKRDPALYQAYRREVSG